MMRFLRATCLAAIGVNHAPEHIPALSFKYHMMRKHQLNKKTKMINCGIMDKIRSLCNKCSTKRAAEQQLTADSGVPVLAIQYYEKTKTFLQTMKNEIAKNRHVRKKIIPQIDQALAQAYNVIRQSRQSDADHTENDPLILLENSVLELFEFLRESYGGAKSFESYGAKKLWYYCTYAIDKSEDLPNSSWSQLYGSQLLVAGGHYQYTRRPTFRGIWRRDYLGVSDGLMRIVPDNYMEQETVSVPFKYTPQYMRDHCVIYDAKFYDDPVRADRLEYYKPSTVQSEFDLVRRGMIESEELEGLQNELLTVIRRFGEEGVVLDMPQVISKFSANLKLSMANVLADERRYEIVKIVFANTENYDLSSPKWHIDRHYGGFPVTLLTLLGPGTVFLKKDKTFHYIKRLDEAKENYILEPVLTESALTELGCLPDDEPFEQSKFASTQIVSEDYKTLESSILHATPKSLDGYDDETPIPSITMTYFDGKTNYKTTYENVKRVLVLFKDFDKAAVFTHKLMLEKLLLSLEQVLEEGKRNRSAQIIQANFRGHRTRTDTQAPPMEDD